MSEPTPTSDQPAPERSPAQVITSPVDLPASPFPEVPRMLDEVLLEGPRYRRRVALPLSLFLISCATTFSAGVYGWAPIFLDSTVWLRIREFWPQGLTYAVAVLAILLAHEMGHFLMTVRYRIAASYPIFIPMPFIMITGTMGAVIGMDGLRADRRQLFDIGLAGPLAGLVLTIPLVCIGLKTAVAKPAVPARAAVAGIAPTEGYEFGRPLLVKLLLPYLRPDLPPNAPFEINALYMAGWVGMLITGLNMLPVSQLDGGHIIYGLLGRHSRWIARAFLFGSILAIVIGEQYSWLLMLVLVIFLGADHPTTFERSGADRSVAMDDRRGIAGDSDPVLHPDAAGDRSRPRRDYFPAHRAEPAARGWMARASGTRRVTSVVIATRRQSPYLPEAQARESGCCGARCGLPRLRVGLV